MHKSFIFKAVLSVLLVAGIGWYGYRLATSEPTTPFESFLVTILLAAFTWALSYWVSKSDAENAANDAATSRIDAIARQSSQKLSDQSTNIFELEQYVEFVLLNKQAGGPVDETDLYGLIQMLRTLRRTNTGLMEDWNGVASSTVSQGIIEQAKKQSELFKQIARPNGTDNSEREREIESISRELPASSVPSSQYRQHTRTVGMVSQQFGPNCSNKFANGTLTVEILNPTFTFTAAGKLEPLFSDVPGTVFAELLDRPAGCPKNLRLGGGTGTVYDFSVHLKSEEFGASLPAGTYKFQYTVK